MWHQAASADDKGIIPSILISTRNGYIFEFKLKALKMSLDRRIRSLNSLDYLADEGSPRRLNINITDDDIKIRLVSRSQPCTIKSESESIENSFICVQTAAIHP